MAHGHIGINDIYGKDSVNGTNDSYGINGKTFGSVAKQCIGE